MNKAHLCLQKTRLLFSNSNFSIFFKVHSHYETYSGRQVGRNYKGHDSLYIYQLRYKDTIRDRSERSTDLNFSLYVYTNNHAMRVIGPKLVLYFKNL